jgi:hypothetical protein
MTWVLASVPATPALGICLSNNHLAYLFKGISDGLIPFTWLSTNCFEILKLILCTQIP